MYGCREGKLDYRLKYFPSIYNLDSGIWIQESVMSIFAPHFQDSCSFRNLVALRLEVRNV